MKQLIIFLAIILVPMSVYSQADKPAKKDNAIIIMTEDSDSLNFINFGRHLVNNGYSFAQKDKDFYVLVTNLKKTKKGYKVDYRLVVSFVNSDIIIRPELSNMSLGAFMAGDVEIVTIKWQFKPAKSDLNNKAYIDFDPVLRAFNGDINYFKE